MSSLIPAEILLQIYSNLPLKDVLTCQYVCHAWHVPAKRKFYEIVEFNSSISISLFVSCISKTIATTIPSPGEYVRKISLIERPVPKGQVNSSIGLTLSVQHVHSLVTFCPNIEIIESSSNFYELVLQALYTLPTHVELNHLKRIPYFGSRYYDCAIKFCKSLQKLYLTASYPRSQGYELLKKFSNLNKLCMIDYTVHSYLDLFNILNYCPKLTDLQIHLDQLNDANMESPALMHDLLLETLYVSCASDILEINVFNQLLNRMNYLKEFKLISRDILDLSLPTNQFAEITVFFQLITERVPNVSVTIHGRDHNKVNEIAILYLQAMFQPRPDPDWYTSLMIMNNNMRGYEFCELVKYELEKDEKTIEMLLPGIELEDRALHASYIQQFSPHVNTLIINYEGTQLNQHGCEYFLETVVEKCNVLESLTLICGNYSEWNCRMINPSIHRISLIASFLSPTFFHNLTNVCPSLKKLEIYKCHFNITNDVIHYYMPNTCLEEIEFNLDQFKLGSFYEANSVIIKVILSSKQRPYYYYTDYDLVYMVELPFEDGERELENQDTISVIMEFNDLCKIRATYFGIPGIEIKLH